MGWRGPGVIEGEPMITWNPKERWEGKASRQFQTNGGVYEVLYQPQTSTPLTVDSTYDSKEAAIARAEELAATEDYILVQVVLRVGGTDTLVWKST